MRYEVVYSTTRPVRPCGGVTPFRTAPSYCLLLVVMILLVVDDVWVQLYTRIEWWCSDSQSGTELGWQNWKFVSVACFVETCLRAWHCCDFSLFGHAAPPYSGRDVTSRRCIDFPQRIDPPPLREGNSLHVLQSPHSDTAQSRGQRTFPVFAKSPVSESNCWPQTMRDCSAGQATPPWAAGVVTARVTT